MLKKILLILLLPIMLFAQTPKLRVSYFMTTYRCQSCHYLENMTKKTLQTQFNKEMKDSVIVFRMLNIDKFENKHYIKDYKMKYKSVVLEKLDGDSVAGWNRLDSLWNYIDKDDEFINLLSKEIRAQLK